MLNHANEQTIPKHSNHKFSDESLKPLIKSAIDGDGSALNQLCEAVVDQVMFRTSKIMYNHSDAEDVAQEALLRMCKNIRMLKDPAKFNAWFSSIIINESRRKMKNNTKTPTVLNFEDEMDSMPEEDNVFYAPDSYMERKEQRGAIMDVIGDLSLRQRQAILLHYFDEMSVTETANVMGVSQSNVTLYLKNARNKIKSKLEPYTEWSWESGTAHGFSAVPLGVLVSNALGEECRIFQSDVLWVSETLEKCSEVAFAAGVAGAAVLTAAGSCAAVSSGETIVVSECTATAAKTGGVASVFGTCATILATVAISAAVAATTIFNVSDDPVFQPPVSTYARAQIEFVGENGLSHINPSRAVKMSDSVYGELSVIGWHIRSADSTSVLYSGKGGFVEDVFAQMRSQGEYGVYYLEFLLEDVLGARHLLGHNFVITEY
ncbi:MAG: sigma-70 family RNA polymerase sigma factor [Oscillospiraceae bacterium]|nr:sigma-70 family RNA polymerase sigma factor [Oscillospiraceae bacterium]